MKRQLVLTEAGKKLRFRKLIQKKKEEQINYYLTNPHLLQEMPPLERINPPNNPAYPNIKVEPVHHNCPPTPCHSQNEEQDNQKRRKPNETPVIHFSHSNFKDSIEFQRKPQYQSKNRDEEGGRMTGYEADQTTPYAFIKHRCRDVHEYYMPPKLTSVEEDESDNDTIEKEDDTKKDTPENYNYRCYVHKKFRTCAEYSYSDQQKKDNRYNLRI